MVYGTAGGHEGSLWSLAMCVVTATAACVCVRVAAGGRTRSWQLAQSAGEAQAGKKPPKPFNILNLGPPKTQIPIQ